MRTALPCPLQSDGLNDGGSSVAGGSRGAGVGAGAGAEAGDRINTLYISSKNTFSGYKKNITSSFSSSL
jgi:hypothetical protein